MVSDWLKKIEDELKIRQTDRHSDLIKKLAGWIAAEYKNGEITRLNFICTHNSRRSQFAQTWCTFVQSYLGIETAESYSGGTEVTACNERTINALARTGLKIESEGTGNPVYYVLDDNLPAKVNLWSKVFDDHSNPHGKFAAVMTCDHADQNCPFIPGATLRVPLTYTDPKYADETEEENEAYDLTCSIIATDMLRLFKQVKLLI